MRVHYRPVNGETDSRAWVRRAQLAESLGAMELTLSNEDVKQIEAALPPTAVAGTRYDEHQMRVLDSER